MPESTLQFVHAMRLARAGSSLDGEVALSRMARLAPLLQSLEGAARFEFRFDLDEVSRPVALGQIRAKLEVICQRCLEPMTVEIESEVRLGIVRRESEAVALSPEYEPLQVDGDRISLLSVIEDELILALPSAPLHPPGRCRPPRHPRRGVVKNETEAKSPFAVLAAAKRDVGSTGP